MGEILGLGVTHYPMYSVTDERMADVLRRTLEDEALPEELRSPDGWPAAMREEWGLDRGASAARSHRRQLLDGFVRCREALDDFAPDVVLIWGDDQYENFREEVIPPFCILAYDDIEVRPFEGQRAPNVWGAATDSQMTIRGAKEFGKFLAGTLMAENVDVAYSYQLRSGQILPHAFLNTVLFLDHGRTGFDYPILPMAINCYGRHVISRRGGIAPLHALESPDGGDPPSPSPLRCFDVGAAVARCLAASPWRVALVASASWSHAFLHDAALHLYPAIEADRQLYDALRNADYEAWRRVSLSDIENNGQQEMLNWFCLVGAMSELGLKPRWTNFVESHVLNSNKCFAVFN